jgi:hypothetical protein
MKKVVYSLHPGFAMEEAVINNLVKRSGRPLSDWIEIACASGLSDEKKLRNRLKKEHGLSTNQAAFLVERAKGKGGAVNYNPEQLVDDMYAGSKIGLRPLYNLLIEKLFEWVPDISLSPGKSVVSVYGNRLFANIKPATKSRIDFGLALGEVKAADKLLDTGGLGKKDKITHRIEIAASADINDTLRTWFEKAADHDRNRSRQNR